MQHACIFCDMANPLLAIILMVKNEEAAMQPTLQPFIDAGINSYLILDTGSTDNTIKVTQDLFSTHNVTGYIIEQPFIDFSTSRNYALQCAEEKFPHAAFFLMIDAEWITHNVQGLLEFCKNHLNDTINVYDIRIVMRKNNSTHCMHNLIRAHKNMRYEGELHEGILTETLCILPENIYFELPVTRYGDDKTQKRFTRDLDILLKAHAKDPNNSRTLFYLAQTYTCLNDLENARKYLLLRSQFRGDNLEEDFISHYRLGVIHDALHDWPNALQFYFKAHVMRPTRAEPLVWLAYHYLLTKEYALSFLFAQRAVQIPYPKNDILFIENELYDYMRYDVLSQVAGYLNEFDLGEWATRKALEAHPEMAHLQANLDLYLKIKSQLNSKS